MKTGQLAESWNVIEPGHMVFKIRQGVRWALNPKSEASRLVGGREVTVDDLIVSIQRKSSLPTAYTAKSYPEMSKSLILTAPDKWTLDIKTDPDYFTDALCMIPDCTKIYPREVIEKYGDMQNWKNSVSSGPFILSDYVPSSVLTFISNPNYWENNPIGPGKGDKIPYVDGVRQLIIPDMSTRSAAVRTGKLDHAGTPLAWEEGVSLIKTPGIKHQVIAAAGSNLIYMRLDNTALPWAPQDDPKALKVRWALTMAINFNSIVKDYYGGHADLMTWPIAKVPEYKKAYLPFEEFPKEVQELYSYNPEKAKQLLKEAGYPNGFKAKILCWADQVDQLSIVKAMWADVGINLELEIKEYATYNSTRMARTYQEMVYANPGATAANYVKNFGMQGPSYYNGSFVNDPYVNEMKTKLYNAFNNLDYDTVDKLMKEVTAYGYSRAWVIPMPLSDTQEVWWPWIKNYNGEMDLGYCQAYAWARYTWLDQDLKKSMGY